MGFRFDQWVFSWRMTKESLEGETSFSSGGFFCFEGMKGWFWRYVLFLSSSSWLMEGFYCTITFFCSILFFVFCVCLLLPCKISR